MQIPWDKLFELLFKMLEDCSDEQSSRAEFIHDNPGRVRFGVRRALRQEGFRGVDLRAAVETAMSEFAAASEAEVAAFCSGEF